MSKTMSRSTGRNAALAIGLSAAATIFTSPVAAQILVTDGASITANNAGFAAQLAKTIDQFRQQVQAYETQVQQYQQMLTKVMNLGTDFSIMPNTMTEMDADPLVQANCSNNTGSIIGNFVNQITTSLMSQSVVKSQQQICAAIITTQVDKYNTTVQMMQQIQSNLPAVQKFTDLASSFSNMGESSSATTQINSYSGQLSTAMSNWKAHMDADDAYIASLQQMQGVLAKKALNGSNNILGDVVQAGTFATAFN
jgi:hypothetical protein